MFDVSSLMFDVRISMLRPAILLWALLATPVFAASYKLPEDDPLITIEIPDKWQAKEVGESIRASISDNSLHLLVLPPEGAKIAETMNEAMRYIRGTGGVVVKADSEKRERRKLNGMEARYFSWQAKDKKGDIRIQFTILFIAERKSVLVANWGPPEAQEKHQADLKKILQSIKETGEK